MFSIYTLGLWLGVSFSLPLGIIHPKIKHYIKNRLGHHLNYPFFPNQPVWFHALSVGEVLSVVPLVKAFKKRYSEISIFFTASTLTGHEMAKKQLKDIADAINYFPLDFPNVINHYLKRINPRLIIFTETDIWPNFLNIMHKNHIPTILISARISERSYKRYCLIKSFVSHVINHLEFIGAQREEDKRRFLGLGFKKEKIKVIGSLKFDLPLPDLGQKTLIRKELNIPLKQTIWIAGSTHRGEDEIILKVHRALLSLFPNLCLIIAPRHPERFDEVTALSLKMGFRTKRRTEDKKGDYEVIVLDTLGELAKAYGISHFAFVGGSFVSIGGHNPLEVAVWARPVIFGPYMFNFSEIAKMLIENKAAIEVKDEKMLFQVCRFLLEDKSAAEIIGEQGRKLVTAHQGVIERYLKLIEKWI